MRVPRPIRTPLLVALLFALHGLAPAPLEALRIGVFARVALPAGLLHGPDAAPSVPALPWAIESALAAAEAATTARFGNEAPQRVVLFDRDTERGRFLVGAGRRHGARRGAAVRTHAGVVAVLDLVDENLSRARFLTARGIRIAAAVDAIEPGRPALIGALRGEGLGVSLEHSALSSELARGAIVRVLSDDPRRAHVIGRLLETDHLAGVELAADPNSESQVLVDGVTAPPAWSDLFESVSARVRFDPKPGRGDVLLELETAAEIPIGAAVVVGRRYLGRIAGVAGADLRAIRPVHPAHGGSFLAIAENSSVQRIAGTELEWAAQGSIARDALVHALVTLGGKDLVPPGLAAGIVLTSGPTIFSPTLDRWPRTVSVVRFRHPEERRRLLLGGRP